MSTRIRLMNDPETYRYNMEARQPREAGGGACSVLVRREHGQIQLIFSGVLDAAANLTEAQAGQLAIALGEVVGAR